MKKVHIESLNGRMWDELLNKSLFFGTDHARRAITDCGADSTPRGYIPGRPATRRRRPTPGSSPQPTPAQRKLMAPRFCRLLTPRRTAQQKRPRLQSPLDESSVAGRHVLEFGLGFDIEGAHAPWTEIGLIDGLSAIRGPATVEVWSVGFGTSQMSDATPAKIPNRLVRGTAIGGRIVESPQEEAFYSQENLLHPSCLYVF